MRGSLFTSPATRLAKWIVFVPWLVAIFLAFGAELPDKFTEAENNEATSYLPGDAESTKALAATEELQDGELAPTVIVYRRDSGLTAADKRTIVADVKRMTEERYPGVVADGVTALSGGKGGGSNEPAAAPTDLPPGCATAGPVPGQPQGYEPFVGPVCSADGKAALVTSYINAEGEAELITEPVQDWRDLISGDRDGLEAKITGGVLLDTFLVRSVLVPALALTAGDNFWWPSSLSHRDETIEQPPQRPPSDATVAVREGCPLGTLNLEP